MLVWRVLSRSGCRVVWCVLLCWLEHIVVWVHLSSAHRPLSSVTVALAHRMTHNSSLPFLYCIFLITACCVLDYHIHVYYQECVMCTPRIGLFFVLIYLICSWCIISIDLPVWPAYDMLHVLHCNWYIPLEYILFCGVLSHNWLYMVLHVQNSAFKSLFLKRLVTLCMSGLWYINVILFLSLYLCGSIFCSLCLDYFVF